MRLLSRISVLIWGSSKSRMGRHAIHVLVRISLSGERSLYTGVLYRLVLDTYVRLGARIPDMDEQAILGSE
jgi:hypothetical protein